MIHKMIKKGISSMRDGICFYVNIRAFNQALILFKIIEIKIQLGWNFKKLIVSLSRSKDEYLLRRYGSSVGRAQD